MNIHVIADQMKKEEEIVSDGICIHKVPRHSIFMRWRDLEN